MLSEYDYADLEFHLDDHLDNDELLTAITFIYFGGYGAKVGTGLEYINREGMNDHLGGRVGAPDIIIYLTTNTVKGSGLARKESELLQQAGTTVIVAGVGAWDRMDNMWAASGCHYITQVPDFGHTDELLADLIRLTCDAANQYPANYCPAKTAT